MKPVKIGECEERVFKAPVQVAIKVLVGFKSGASHVTFSLVSGDAEVHPEQGHITLPRGNGPVEIHFHLVREGWEGTLVFEDINNWPLIAGNKKMFGDLPKGHSHVEFGVPERRSDEHMQVLYKRIEPNDALAYNLKYLVKAGNARVHEIFNLDPRIINRPK